VMDSRRGTKYVLERAGIIRSLFDGLGLRISLLTIAGLFSIELIIAARVAIVTAFIGV
jgi:hypothetical protein